jgi:hypothetical protein
MPKLPPLVACWNCRGSLYNERCRCPFVHRARLRDAVAINETNAEEKPIDARLQTWVELWCERRVGEPINVNPESHRIVGRDGAKPTGSRQTDRKPNRRPRIVDATLRDLATAARVNQQPVAVVAQRRRHKEPGSPCCLHKRDRVLLDTNGYRWRVKCSHPGLVRTVSTAEACNDHCQRGPAPHRAKVNSIFHCSLRHGRIRPPGLFEVLF